MQKAGAELTFQASPCERYVSAGAKAQMQPTSQRGAAAFLLRAFWKAFEPLYSEEGKSIQSFSSVIVFPKIAAIINVFGVGRDLHTPYAWALLQKKTKGNKAGDPTANFR